MSTDAATKMPSLHKTDDVTLKRGALTTSEIKEDALKKLPGKKKPPILTIKFRQDVSAGQRRTDGR